MTSPSGLGAPRSRSRIAARRIPPPRLPPALRRVLWVDIPTAAPALAATSMRLPPTSALRHAGVARATREIQRCLTSRDLDRVVRYYTEDCLVRTVGDAAMTLPRMVEGRDGVLTWYREFVGSFSDLAWSPFALVHLSSSFAVLNGITMRGRASGIGFEDRFVQHLHIRGGKIAEQVLYWSWDEGLAAVAAARGDY